MKNNTCFNLWGILLSFNLFVIFFLLAPAFLVAGNVKLDERNNALDIKENSYSTLHIINTFSNFDCFNVKTEMGTFSQLRAAEYSYTQMTGAPMLPVLRKLIEVPFGAVPEVNIISISYEDHSLAELDIEMPLIPAQPPVAKNSGEVSPFEYNATIYGTDEFYGVEPVTVDILGVMRGVRIGRLNVAPVQYNPVKKILRIIKEINVEITFKGGNVPLTIQEKQKNESPYFRGLNRMFMNYKPVNTRDTITKYPITFVIVSDPMFQEQLQPYIAWKIHKGFHVIEAYTDDPQVGTTKESIKAYLQSLYEAGTPENPAPSFILFVGDVAQIPAWELSGESDLKYCEYTGDYFPEVYYGRFSATNAAQLQPQIDKTLEYEQYTMPDPSYLGEVVMIGGVDPDGHSPDWANGQINYGTENYFNEAHGILSHTYLYPESGSSASQIIQNVSDGVGYANYTAHGGPSGWGDPPFNVSDIPGLQNQDKYGLLVGNACSTNEFATNECFGEALLRAVNKGAVGYIGGSNSTYWDEDYYWGVGVGPITEDPPSYEQTSLGSYDRMFHDHGEPVEDWYTTQDEMIFAGDLAVTQGSPGMAQYYWEIYCLMGDPSVSPWMGVPVPMAVTYDPLMPLASSSFTVTAEPYAYVAISRDGVLYGAALADESGIADVSLTPITVPGTADIVVTKQNRQPFTGTVVVASPEGPYVLFNTCTINDESGNGNGIADYSETILLNLSLENVGNSEASNLFALLTTDDQYVQITDNSNIWTDIPSGGIVTEDGAFAVVINDSIPDQHKVLFTLQVTDGSDVWTSTFSITLNAPVLSLGNMTIIDTLIGNGNGRLDAGELAEIILSAANTGHSDAKDGIISLSTTNGYLLLNTSSFNIGPIPYNQSTDAIFTVTVDPATPVGTVADFNVHLEALPYMVDKSLSTKIGLVLEDFETANFEAFDWQLSGDADWFITNASPYSGSFCAQSGDINDQQTSALQIAFDVPSDDSISFFRKVSSEATYDFLNFYIDGQVVGQWSGEMDWERVAFPITIGTHTFKWEYTKDYSLSNGSDCGWVDYIVLPSVGSASGPLTLSALAYPDQICTGQSGQLFALPSGGSGIYTYLWSPAESLNDPTVFNPWTTPSQTTLYTVEVIDGQDTVYADVVLPVMELPEAPEIVQQEEQLVSSMETGNQWYIWGEPIAGATDQIYTPSATGEYFVTYTNENGCESVSSNTIYFIYTAVEDLDKDAPVTIYPNPFTEQANIHYFLEHASPVRMTLFNAMGNEIAVLINNESQPAGSHTFVLSASGLKAGLYYCRLQTGSNTVIRKIILSK